MLNQFLNSSNEEVQRLAEIRVKGIPWKKWGPSLSERQWGTVREDYSANGNAWDYFTHDQSRSRAYHWREDGLAGYSDDKQRLCFALALWNGADPILKERLFGLSNRGPEPASLSLLPTLWFRNTWSWTKNAPKPGLKETKAPKGASHQTGWTAGVARLIQYFSAGDRDQIFKGGIRSAAVFPDTTEKDA